MQLQTDCRAADLQVAGADGVPRNHKCMGKSSVVGSGNGLEEEIRVTTCRPCLALIVGASELVSAGSLARVEECLGLSA